jgi:RNA polymerase sigma-70 factor, ECF subfamily
VRGGEANRERVGGGRLPEAAIIEERMARQMENPTHPAVDWAVTQRSAARLQVQIVCPACGRVRFRQASVVRYQIGEGRFTGFCRNDWRARLRTRGRSQPEGIASTEADISVDVRERLRVRLLAAMANAGIAWLVRDLLNPETFSGSRRRRIVSSRSHGRELGGPAAEGAMREATASDARAAPRLRDDAAALDAVAALAARGDDSAFEQIYLALVDDLYTYAYGRCRDTTAAEDIVVNVFCRAWRSVSSYDAGSRQFRRWLYSLARSEVREYRRVTQSKVQMSDGDSATNLADWQALDFGFAGAAVARALGVLTDQQRQVVVLRYFNDKSHREIAQLLGKREGAVRVTLLRALRGLRKALPEFVL